MLEKAESIKKLFTNATTPEEKYKKLIELGRALQAYPSEFKRPEYIVEGCQSIVYLHSYFEDGKLYFKAFSEALISSGLAYLLISVYSGETPETILKCPPVFLDELGITASLTPGRSNGLASMYLRMKQDAIKALTKFPE